MKHQRAVDLKAIAGDAMSKYGFAPRFPESVVREVNAIRPGTLPPQGNDARDLRELLWSSIDNVDSQDLDQLEYCEPGPGGEIRVKIAIADVDLFVPKDSRTDRHASHNTTSIYTGVVTFPMIPERLSHGITSLLPREDRMAVVIEYEVLPDGSVRPGDVYRALVQNKAKLVYEEVGDWLEGSGPIPKGVREVPGLEEQVRLQQQAMVRLKRFRVAQGALDLQTLEAQPVLDDDTVRDLVIQRQNMARCVIEEFMIAANGTMVARLEKARIPMIQRVVRVPKNWEGIRETAAKYHEALPPEPNQQALAAFLRKRKHADPERFPDLSLTIVKLLGHGEYVALEPGDDSIGHFGLAVTDYTHATAPNRRYADVINQRLVKAVLAGKPLPYTPEELQSHAQWITERERASNKVERFMRKAVAAVLLKDRIGDTFDAIVTGAAEKGTWVRLLEPPAEGKVVRGERGLQVGQKVRVRLLKTDPYKAFIDFAYVGRMEG
jgi:exoribonuclease-2